VAAIKQQLRIYLRDISQAYVQSNTQLSRDFFIRPPPEFGLPQGSILKVIKPLYRVPEAGNYWFNTYHRHYTTQLQITQSTYDPCLLYTHKNGFGIIGLQTNDTLVAADKLFTCNEDKKLKKAKFLAKKREQLTNTNPLKFNGGLISLVNGIIQLTQEH
jgi:hypothetical protein